MWYSFLTQITSNLDGNVPTNPIHSNSLRNGVKEISPVHSKHELESELGPEVEEGSEGKGREGKGIMSSIK